MKPLRFRHSPFDIAPGARRYTRTAWRVFAAGLLFLLACVWLLLHAKQELRNAQAAQTDVQAERQAFAAAQRLEQTRLNDPAVMAKTKAQQSLQQMIRMSWFGLFDALETAARDVRGGVSLLSLVPSQAQTEATQVRLTAVAASAPVMLEYLRILRKDPRILSAELNSQQPDENVGPGVIRMQLTVLWNPQALAPAQPAPDVRPTAPGLVADAAIRRDPVARVVVDKGTQ
jgi:hypothetical protein